MAIQDVFITAVDIEDNVLTPEALATLCDTLTKRRQSEPDAAATRLVRSQRGGARIYLPTPVVDGPEMAPLAATIRSRADALTRHLRGTGPESCRLVNAWADWLPDGGFHHVHAHENTSWACVFYVDAAECGPGNGDLQLIDPRPAAYVLSEPGFGQRRPPLSVPAETNRLVMFPGWMQHYVGTYRGSRERLALALNARL
ncbi:MAG: putative 2OG-Fe(II) oxygenase [Pseudomonadota bacterium]